VGKVLPAESYVTQKNISDSLNLRAQLISLDSVVSPWSISPFCKYFSLGSKVWPEVIKYFHFGPQNKKVQAHIQLKISVSVKLFLAYTMKTKHSILVFIMKESFVRKNGKFPILNRTPTPYRAFIL